MGGGFGARAVSFFKGCSNQHSLTSTDYLDCIVPRQLYKEFAHVEPHFVGVD